MHRFNGGYELAGTLFWVQKACYVALYAYNTRIVEDPPHSNGVRFSHSSNGVVGKLRDSRGNGLAGETP
ncbi:hypothetical protein, partial [Halobacillus aidingensis]|uniref:hypothetical protein n=1 Tax=Halobacillus aidingensis TaxID=240303 RepID=UPI001ABF0599